ncbi:Maf-like protein [Vibrio europaeus]|uniref:7-methyl-GTP pyrophosphatase n=1 Tax=Vibrio europaeus TaxID=300876 RepID=A0AAE7AUB9_9VIBR|nr:nucleoside triphosphate pyrophosphatase [Vibrio europaeus]MDC5807250.1 Maf-like protein [Vibrio europaeus]MDC5809845.1 Maf-like protein [Vibrio europaeus]MDC5827775.1 Maf-like protein [Vibrio europaeus]MDC5830619.1 Maf-like protein [Vibrio europaeus]MDC5837475.1 Maf-like protein [Vibrio europaeus]
MPNYQLVLASTSPYRKQLLNKLAIEFDTASPAFDETPLENEAPIELVKRLAQGKAESCSVSQPSIIIGSDQVCVINGNIIGKPHTREKAIEQLLDQSGQSIQFYTGLALHNTRTRLTDIKVDTFTVHFRALSKKQIENYVDKEQPFYCAGSFKSEGLGIALFERLEGKDPNTLVGLPLIDLIDMLAAQGVEVL